LGGFRRFAPPNTDCGTIARRNSFFKVTFCEISMRADLFAFLVIVMLGLGIIVLIAGLTGYALSFTLQGLARRQAYKWLAEGCQPAFRQVICDHAQTHARSAHHQKELSESCWTL